MNIVTVAGQLGRDAELRYLANGDPVLNFSVADDQGKDKPTIWWNASLFGKRAISLAVYMKKGQAITVSGIYVEGDFTDKDGNKKKSENLRVNDVKLQGGQKQAESEPVHRANQQRGKSSSQFDDLDEEIPF